MSVLGGTLGLGRALAESRMTDTVNATRAGEKEWDEEAGEHVAAVISVYTGPARIKHASSTPKDVEAGSQLLTVGQLEVHVPVGSPVFEADDLITVTACPTRADQVGRVFVVIAPFDGSQTTAVRYRVEVSDGRQH